MVTRKEQADCLETLLSEKCHLTKYMVFVKVKHLILRVTELEIESHGTTLGYGWKGNTKRLVSTW